MFPSGDSSIGTTPSREAHVAAICLRAGMDDMERAFKPATLEEMEANFPSGLGLLDTLSIIACSRGRPRHLASDRDVADMFAYAADNGPRAIQASYSTVSLPGILSDVANKFMRRGFNSVENEWLKIASIDSASNFKEIKNFAMTGDLTLEEVGATGEIPHGSLGEAVYQNRITTYAKMLSISRTDFINDDLGAFTTAAAKLGRGGAIAFNKTFWGAFLANSTFFTAERGNYSDAAGTAFDADSLVAADVMFKAQRDPDGEPLGSRARTLLVPPAQEIPAKRLMSQQKLLDSSRGGNESAAGMFQVASSVYLDDETIPGHSADAWYLLADPLDLPVIGAAFLNGQRQPIIESSEADFRTLGVQIRAVFDFGVSLLEHRGGVKFAGTPAEE